MAWLGGDGFDFYASGGGVGELLVNSEQWAACNSTESGFIVAGGRFGAGCHIRLYYFSAPAFLKSAPFANTSPIYVNLNIRVNGTTQMTGFYLTDGANKQMGFYVKERAFVITAGEYNATVIATSGVLAPLTDTWFHLQVKVTINDLTGSVEVRINGNPSADWNPTNINTRNGSGNDYCNGITFRESGISFFNYLDDVYWFSGTGAAPNTWQGDIRAVQLLPDADASTQWTRNTGSFNYTAVDDGTGSDGDGTYVSDNTAGDADQYSLGNLATAPVVVVAVQSMMNYRMDDAGPHTVKCRLHSGTTDADGDTKSCTASYQWTQKVYTTNPDTGTAWTQTTINALQIGPVNVS